MNNKEEFLKVKEAYKSARTEERKSIIGFITKKKDKEGNFLFTKSKDKPYTTRNQYSGGGGNKKYTSGSSLSRPYDLSNHMWIDLSYKGNDILISLQSFDIDPNSKELHVLYDRIGILFEQSKKIPIFKSIQENTETFRREKSARNKVVSSTREFWNLRSKTKSWNFFEVR